MLRSSLFTSAGNSLLGVVSREIRLGLFSLSSVLPPNWKQPWRAPYTFSTTHFLTISSSKRHHFQSINFRFRAHRFSEAFVSSFFCSNLGWFRTGTDTLDCVVSAGHFLSLCSCGRNFRPDNEESLPSSTSKTWGHRKIVWRDRTQYRRQYTENLGQPHAVSKIVSHFRVSDQQIFFPRSFVFSPNS